MTVYVDSSAWYAAADTDEAAHERTVALLSEADVLLTSDHVVVETWFLLNSRLGPRAAEAFLHRSVGEGLAVAIVSAADLGRAVDIGERFSDQRFSVVDRTSFAVMERLGLHTVIALDDDFAIYRYGPKRRRSFTVLR